MGDRSRWCTQTMDKLEKLVYENDEKAVDMLMGMSKSDVRELYDWALEKNIDYLSDYMIEVLGEDVCTGHHAAAESMAVI